MSAFASVTQVSGRPGAILNYPDGRCRGARGGRTIGPVLEELHPPADTREPGDASLRWTRERQDALEELECRLLRLRLFGPGAAPERFPD